MRLDRKEDEIGKAMADRSSEDLLVKVKKELATSSEMTFFHFFKFYT